MIKHIILVITISVYSSFCIAQSGPGGVGNSASNEAWFIPEEGLLNTSDALPSDGDEIKSWTDISGNSVVLNKQGTGPTYSESVYNSVPGLTFSSHALKGSIGGGALNASLSLFIVGEFSLLNQSDGDYEYMLYCGSNTSNNFSISRTTGASGEGENRYYTYTNGGFKVSSDVITGGVPHVFSMNYLTSSPYHNFNMDSEALSISGISSGPNTSGEIGLGRLSVGGTPRYLNGNITELIVYDEELNDAQMLIIENYLSAKFNIDITSSGNDFYTENSGGTFYGNDVIGIGNKGGDTHETAQGRGIVNIHNPSSLDLDDFVFMGHEGSATTSTDLANVPAVYIPTAGSRMQRVWKIENYNSSVTVDLSFMMTGLNFGEKIGVGNEEFYELLIDDDGDFTSGTTLYRTGYIRSGDTITFTGISIDAAKYITIGNPNGIRTITSGDWNDPTTWNCNCIPSVTDNPVVILNLNTVTIDANSVTGGVSIQSGGALDFTGTSSLTLSNDFSNEGTFTAGNGSLQFAGTSLQAITNLGTLVLNEFVINNSSGVILNSGSYTVSNNLQLLDGTLNVNGNALTLLSSSSKTARIAEITSGSITGEITIQRFIESGANRQGWRALGAPLTGITLNDLDDNLIISGTGFSDGCAIGADGCFFSARKYGSGGYTDITSMGTSLATGEGFEVWIGDNSDKTTLDASITMDVTGGVNGTGTISATTFDGYNLIGNPYASQIDFDNLTFSNVNSDFFYVYDPSTNSFEYYSVALGVSHPSLTGGLIGSFQGFWVHGTGAGSVGFNQNDKTSSTAPFWKSNRGPLENKEAIRFALSSDLNTKTSSVLININKDELLGKGEFGIPALQLPGSKQPLLASYLENESSFFTAHSFDAIGDKDLFLVTKVSDKGTYKLDIENIASLKSYECATLSDLETGMEYDLKKTPSFEFDITNARDYSPRFQLSLKESCEGDIINGIESSNQEFLTIRNNNNTISLDYYLPDSHSATIFVRNAIGQTLVKPISINNGRGTQTIDLSNHSGVLIIELLSTNKRIIRKFVLSK